MRQRLRDAAHSGAGTTEGKGQAVAGGFPNRHRAPISGVMHLDLTDEESAALTQEPHDIVESDRYPFSPRIRTLTGIILAKLRPDLLREPLPPPKLYSPPRAKRRRG